MRYHFSKQVWSLLVSILIAFYKFILIFHFFESPIGENNGRSKMYFFTTEQPLCFYKKSLKKKHSPKKLLRPHSNFLVQKWSFGYSSFLLKKSVLTTTVPLVLATKYTIHGLENLVNMVVKTRTNNKILWCFVRSMKAPHKGTANIEKQFSMALHKPACEGVNEKCEKHDLTISPMGGPYGPLGFTGRKLKISLARRAKVLRLLL